MEVEDLLRGRPPETIERRHRLIDPRHRAPVSLGRECHNTARRVPREQILAFDFELCAHLFRGGREQFVEQLGRQVGAKCRPKSCSGRQGGWPFYCLRSPQYLCGPLSQQPDFMHADWRSPQLVRQVDIDDRLRLFLHAAIQIFSSPLQRIGAEKAGAAESRASCRCPRDATRRPQLPGCVACPGGLRLIRTLRSSWPDLSGHPCL